MQGALIGCGFFAQNHLHAWAELAGAQIVAVCDLDPAKAQAAARKFGARPYSSTGALYAAETLDFIDIATTVESHLPLVREAVTRAGVVICQKPFAETLGDAQAMVDAAVAAGAQLIIHENFRWEAPFLEMKRMLDAGVIGTPHLAQFSFRHGYDNYVNQPYLKEIEKFAIMDVGLHLFDVARFFMGEVATIACTTQTLNPEVRGEDAFTALLKHESGASCITDCSFFSTYSPEPFPNTAGLIEGSTGSLVLDRYNRLTHHSAQGAVTHDLDPTPPQWGARPWHAVQDSVLNFQRHAIEVMHGRALPQPSGADNLRTLALAEAAYRSAETAQTIAV